MNIVEFLNIESNKKEMISIVGAGGKTTLLYNISKELKRMYKRILLTTTTHIYIPPKDVYTDLFLSNSRETLFKYAEAIKDKDLFIIGDSITKEKKIKGIDISIADEIYKLGIFDFILIEADGSKKKPIKAPAEWEPMIPQMSSMVIGVIGLDSLGKIVVEDSIHRLKEFCNISECRPGDIINGSMIAKLIKHPKGLFKNTPEKAEKIALLNKADNGSLIEAGFEIKRMIEDDSIKIVITSMKNNMYWM